MIIQGQIFEYLSVFFSSLSEEKIVVFILGSEGKTCINESHCCSFVNFGFTCPRCRKHQ